MTTFKKILLPTNFSEVAVHAARFARALAEDCGGTLYVLHVSQPVLAAATPDGAAGLLTLPPNDADLLRGLRSFVRDELGSLRMPAVTALRTGSPAATICDYAHEIGADVIVLGTHARGLASRLFLGSVSKEVLEQAGCPVLMVPLAARAWEESHDPGELVTSGRHQGAF